MPKAVTTLVDIGLRALGNYRTQRIEAGIQEHREVFMALNPEHVAELIAHGAQLSAILSPKVLQSKPIQLLVRADSAMLDEVLSILSKYHPALGKVLSTPGGKAWLLKQQTSLQ